MKNNIKKGYKPSPLGPIPDDWEVKELDEVAEFLDGRRKAIKDADRAKMQGVYPYYGASGIIDYVNDYIFDENLILLGEDGANIINRSTPLAFKVSGKIWVNNHAHVLKPKKGTNLGFLTEFLESIKYDKYNTGTAQPKLNKEVCSSIPILHPPLKEQIAIANLLSMWDKAINTLTQLIAQKEQRKKWLMYQLLTGKKRLKGFEKVKWKTQPLESFIKPITREVPKPNEPYLGIGLRSHGKGTFLKPGEQPEKNSMDTFYVVRPNDLIVNITFAWEQAIAIVRPEDNGALASHRFPTYTFIKGKGQPDFFRFFILQPRMKYMLDLISPGGAGRNRVMSKSDFIKLEFLLPEFDEQTAIAKLLKVSDREIQILGDRLEKIKNQKRGLMQILLTGKKRLKIKK